MTTIDHQFSPLPVTIPDNTFLNRMQARIKTSLDRITNALNLATASDSMGISTFVSVGTAVTTLSLNDPSHGIHGETDGGYFITGEMIANGGAVGFFLRPNGLVPANQRVMIDYIAAGAPGNFQDTNFLISSRVGQVYASFRIIMGSSKTGQRRPYYCEAFAIIAGLVETKYTTRGDWDDTTTPISDLQIFANAANGIGVGSWAVLTRLGRGL